MSGTQEGFADVQMRACRTAGVVATGHLSAGFDLRHFCVREAGIFKRKGTKKRAGLSTGSLFSNPEG
jgi:hypothetical protein